MRWDLIRPVLKSVVESTTGLTAAGAVAWKGSKNEGGFRPQVVANLSIGPVSGVGNDEERASYDAGTNTRTVTRCGQRTFTMTVRIETQDQGDASIAMVYADRLRVRMMRDSIASQLLAVGVAWADMHPTQTLEGVKVQGRTLSVAIVEVVFNGVENDVDDTAGASDWIESASIAHENLNNEAGQPIAGAIEVTT